MVDERPYDDTKSDEGTEGKYAWQYAVVLGRLSFSPADGCKWSVDKEVPHHKYRDETRDTEDEVHQRYYPWPHTPASRMGMVSNYCRHIGL